MVYRGERIQFIKEITKKSGLGGRHFTGAVEMIKKVGLNKKRLEKK